MPGEGDHLVTTGPSLREHPTPDVSDGSDDSDPHVLLLAGGAGCGNLTIGGPRMIRSSGRRRPRGPPSGSFEVLLQSVEHRGPMLFRMVAALFVAVVVLRQRDARCGGRASRIVRELDRTVW